MALDWFSGLIGYDASGLRVGQVLSVGPDGEIEWVRERWETAEGSYSASVQVTRELSTPAMRASGFLCGKDVLRVSGNPTKFLQGHNVFGPSVSAAGPIIKAMVNGFPKNVRPPDCESEQFPAVHRSRYDIALHVGLGGHKLVHEWLHAAGSSTRSRHGRALVSGDTVYWGKHSSRWSMKAYCKFCELKEHKLIFPGSDVDELRAYCEGHLRLELVLRRPELKDRGPLTEDIVWEFYDKLTVGVSEMEVTAEVVERLTLSTACKMSLRRWLEGADVRFELPKATFYRYRSQILEEVGVDISLPRDEQWGDLERVGFDVEYLRSRQVSEVPAGLQRMLFKV